MYKVTLIGFILLIVVSCSVNRRIPAVYENDKGIDFVLASDLEMRNISSKGFFIRKADIELIAGGEKEKLSANIRRTSGNEYLISLRSKTGLEAARVYVSDDTVLINDRINSQVLYGKPESLEKRYGVSFRHLALLFGDFVSERTEIARRDCLSGISEFSLQSDGIELAYIIDCKNVKPASVNLRSQQGKSVVRIFYSGFVRKNGYVYPSEVRIEDDTRGMILLLEFGEVEIPWNGSVEFIPGSRFDKVELK